MENKDKAFYRKAISMLVPITIQNLLSATIVSMDVVMLNSVGQSAISAVSLAANYTNILFMFLYGVATGATTLCAQYYGKKDLKAISAIEGIVLRFSLSAAAIFALCAIFIPELMMKIFTNDAELITIGASYLRVVSVSYLCWGIIEIYLAILKSIDRVAICTVLNLIAFIFNIIFNAIFIYGLFGMPRMGAIGAALGTTLSRLVELTGCIIISVFSKDVKLKLSYMFHSNKLLFKDFIKISLPALGNDVSWGIGFSMYSVILGHLGNDAVAANSIVMVVRNFGTVLCFGVGSATGIILGNEIGANLMEEARDHAKKLMKMTIITGAIGGLIVLAVTPFVLTKSSLTETAMHYLKYMMLINIYYIMGTAVNTTLIAGTFRAGGDTRWGLICDTIDMWCYAVPLGFLAAFVFKLPVLVVYFLLCTDEFVKWPWVIAHYRSGKWLNNITRDNLEVTL